MKDTLWYGPTPHGEDCSQVGDEDYAERSRKECAAYRNQLLRQLERAFGEVPNGLTLRMKGESHDFGTYYEVVSYFHTDDEAARDAAWWLDSNLPEHWDEEAKKELAG